MSRFLGYGSVVIYRSEHMDCRLYLSDFTAIIRVCIQGLVLTLPNVSVLHKLQTIRALIIFDVVEYPLDIKEKKLKNH
jgi:hypothetical protein